MSDRKVLQDILQELTELGFSTNEPVSGADAVEYLVELYEMLAEHIGEQEPRDDPDAWSGGFAENH
jgi:hypothetical protein